MELAKRILIVEDEALVSFTLKVILERAGHEVMGITAYGEDAVKTAESGRPDLILMDIFLQGNMNGIDAAALINEKAKIPIIFITGNSDDATYRQAMRTGPAAYLHKPVQKKDILEAIRHALAGEPSQTIGHHATDGPAKGDSGASVEHDTRGGENLQTP
jgi:DNA-binding NarL/FixJ family response regulator